MLASRTPKDANPSGSLSSGVQSPAVNVSRPGNKQEATPAAIGIRVHSGWGVLVAISGKTEALEVLERRRIEIIDRKVSGAAQPYHFAEKLEIREAEKHLERCTAMAATQALARVREVVSNLRDRGYSVTGAAILLSSGRTLPGLEKILASHPMIHTAEGEFFRRAFRQACEALKIAVAGIRERELDARATEAFGKAASRVKQSINRQGRSLGPPWTQDQKAAALAATLALAMEP
jgi:hypothetical protein